MRQTNLNNPDTIKHFLQNGPLTQSFLDDKKLDKKIANAKSDMDKVNTICNYIHTKKFFKQPAFASKEYKAEHKFQRTAAEIWDGGIMTGCTDYALVFSTIARQYNIPTTFLATAEKGCAEAILNGDQSPSRSGHAFCECFVDDKWVLVDPIARITEQNYNPNDPEIHLTGSHTVGGKQDFIPYSRDLDIGHKQTTKEYNKAMDYAILSKEPEPEIAKVSQEELENAGFVQQETPVSQDYKPQEKTHESVNENTNDEELVWKKPDDIN